MIKSPDILWQPSKKRIAHSNISAFIKLVNKRWQAGVADSDALYDWSVGQPEQFWTSVWDFCGVIADSRGERVLVDGDKMPGAKWFPDARLNFAENLLRRRDDEAAMVFWGEDKVRRRMSFAEVYDAVSRMAQAMSATGVKQGDRVAAFMPNMPETIIFMLATTSLGAIWSSCSPDFGAQGVLDRFGQIEPVVLFAVEGYHYNGKVIDTLPRIAEIAKNLPSLKRTVLVSYTRERPDISTIQKAVHLGDFVGSYAGKTIAFKRLPFNHPLFIMYSSGTTGVPKCIVHGAGGTLIQHVKEHLLHSDIKSGDRQFYFTTCGWMMWNWLVSGLASGATLLLYDGSPFHPDGNILWDYAQEEKATLFGTSAKYIDALKKAELRPGKTHDLTSIRTVLSTGSPLAPDSFEYVYEAVKGDVHLASMSGGTDIFGCFVLGIPIKPVYTGEIQGPALGFAVEVFDDAGKAQVHGKGELVCTKPFPSMPLGFWNDPGDKK